MNKCTMLQKTEMAILSKATRPDHDVCASNRGNCTVRLMFNNNNINNNNININFQHCTLKRAGKIGLKFWLGKNIFVGRWCNNDNFTKTCLAIYNQRLEVQKNSRNLRFYKIFINFTTDRYPSLEDYLSD